jgi:DNA-binding NarL/FixJ family response regulator
MISVLLVDDHTAFRQPLAFMLGREPDITVLGEAGSLAEARGMLDGVDIPIIDIYLPDGNGIELVKDLRLVNPQGMVLLLTGSANRHEVACAVEAGASGVLHKSVSIAEIISAVRHLSAGEYLFSPREIMEIFRLAAEQRERERHAQLLLAQLTPRERDVLQALADGLNDKEIAQRLYISYETVRTHMVNILRKLEADSRLQALIFALRCGAVTIR